MDGSLTNLHKHRGNSFRKKYISTISFASVTNSCFVDTIRFLYQKITDLSLDTNPRSRPQIFKGLIQLLSNEELPGPDFSPADPFTKHGSTSIPNSSTHGDVLNTFFERTLSQRFRKKIDLPSCTKGFTCSQTHLPQSCSSA